MRRVVTPLVVALAALLLTGCEERDGTRRLVGQLESDRVEIAADVAEPVAEIAVAEGEAVAKGALLLVQDTSRIEARIEEARAMLSERQARLDELVRGPRQEQITAARASLEGARQQVAFRRREFERAERVLERQLASPESVDVAQAALDAAEAELEVREARLSELLEGTTVEELAQAENAVRQAEARLSLLEIEERRHSAFAPADGVVDSRLFEAGERPSPGQPVMIFLAGEQPYARVYVPESVRASVVPGTAARVYVDGLAGPVEGRVRWVSAEAAFTPYFALTERDRGRLSYAAKVDLVRGLPRDRRLPDGVPVEVEFLPPSAED